MRRGAEKRFEERYVAYDQQKNNRIGASGLVCLVAICSSIPIIQKIPVPGFAQQLIGIVTVITILLAVAWYWRKSMHHLAAKHDLLCSTCSHPLDSIALRRRKDDPDKRIDGQPPSRCPNCHVPIMDALR